MKRTSEINIQVHLDEQSHPEKLEWSATDAPFEGTRECKAMLLSVFDPNESGTLRIDLWGKEMRVDEMDKLFYETFATMADTYSRATGNQKGVEDIRNFAAEFGVKTGLLKPKA